MPAPTWPKRAPPQGTVTFLFTDIEGSTRLWETEHDAMQVALAHHDAVLSEAIEAHNGTLFKTTGDGAHAAFALAADALAACLTAQRRLTAHTWGKLSLRSRMALHSGAAEARDGDYFGPALNRTARLMAAAHGGQILLSLATEELVRDHLPVNTTLRDMGERRLKDLIRPERVYQVIAPDLPADFPPLRTLDLRPNNLPAQTTPFIGREDEIRALKAQLVGAKVRLLTLSGVGGTGKTRLALQVAADLVDDFEHGVYFVPLAALTDPALVLPAIAKALNVREASGHALHEQVAQHLRELQILLVLDNFEQVIDASPVVGALLTAAPRLKVLVTSREVLRVSGEVNAPVPPLSLPDPGSQVPLERLTQYAAVALFIDRALAVNPAFAVTNDNAPALAEICHRLEGLPLAIELAAARARVLAPQRMLVELGNRLAFVTGTARDLTARQRTLRGAIDWSHDLLTSDEQKLFRRLAVFVGGFTLEAIVPVCDLEGDLNLLDTIESLVAKSLVKPADVGQSRFAMLESIRDYAAERLQAAEEAAVLRERQRNVFLALAREAIPHLSRADQGAWLDRLESEHDNMRAALDWSLAQANAAEGEALLLCGALARFWWTRGHLSEGRNWCARALASAGSEGQRAARAGALNGAGALAYYQGDFAAARTLYAESLALYRELGDQKSTAILANNLGNVAIEQGDYAHAQQLYEESLVVRREMGDKLGIATALSNLGNALAEQGDYATARARVQESLVIDRETGDTSGIAISLNNLGDYACEQGDYPGAKTLYEEALAIKRELGDRVGIAITLTGLGNVLAEQGDFGGAQSLYAESLEMRRALGDRRGIAYSLEGLAAVQAAIDGASRAARIWGAAERLREELRAPLPANERPRYGRRVTAARAALGDDVGFDRAWAEGRGLTIEQAIALTSGAGAERT